MKLQLTLQKPRPFTKLPWRLTNKPKPKQALLLLRPVAEVASAKVKAGMNATASQAQATTLPQTGNAATDSMTVLGLALAGMLFGGIGLKKQRN